MKINIELTKHGLQQVQNLEYKVGDCLFDSIAYLLNYSISLVLIWKNNMLFTIMINNWYTSSTRVSTMWIKSKNNSWFTSWKSNK
jgi:hypothetical protein